MTAWPEASGPRDATGSNDGGAEASAERTLRDLLARTRRRLTLIAITRGSAAGLAIGVVPLVLAELGVMSPSMALTSGSVLAVAVLFIWHWKSAASRNNAAVCIEHRAQDLRNLLVTAAELADDPSRARPTIRALVFREAARACDRLSVPALFPMQTPLWRLSAAVVLFAVLGTLVVRARPILLIGHGPHTPVVTGLDVVVEPPAYTGLQAVSVRSPDRLDVIEGSHVRVRVTADSAASVTMDGVAEGFMEATGQTSTHVALTHDGDQFVGDVTASADGYLAFQPAGADGAPGVRRLVALVVRPDKPPVVRIEKPGRDLYVSDPKRQVELRIDAEDDLGLRSLQLKYTKVSGSGESFTFTEGELPMHVTNTSATVWTAQGALSPAALGLTTGDMVVYRAVAADNRPGAAPAESDAFVIEIVRPGDALVDGFAVDDTFDRYKFSQQMVIVKTEGLIAQKPTLSAEAFVDQANNIGAEQRRVRAEFVFMLGGELSDEEAGANANASIDPTQINEESEAVGEADLAAGRMQNQGRIDLLTAIRRMSDASTQLSVANAPSALTAEKSALDCLQRAFTKSRYILHTLSIRERIDVTRRLSGSVTGALSWRRDAVDQPANAQVAEIRRALDSLGALASRSTFAAADAREISLLAEAILRVDPAAADLQQVSATLGRAAAVVAAGRVPADLHALLDEAAIRLAAVAATALGDAPVAPRGPAAARLNGALADALRGVIKKAPRP